MKRVAICRRRAEPIPLPPPNGPIVVQAVIPISTCLPWGAATPAPHPRVGTSSQPPFCRFSAPDYLTGLS